MQPLSKNIQNDLIQVNECLKYILDIVNNSNRPMEEPLQTIKEWAIEALKKLPVNNNDLVTKYS